MSLFSQNKGIEEFDSDKYYIKTILVTENK